MLTELLDIRTPWSPKFAHRQPAVATFICSQVIDRDAQRVAMDIASRLLDAFQRYPKKLPALEMDALEAHHRRLVGDTEHPATGWRYALPIALPPAQARQVSRVLGAVVSAADPRFAS